MENSINEGIMIAPDMVLLELKRKTVIKDAEKQLEKYSRDEKLKKAVGGLTLIKLVLVFSGPELIYIDQC
jgi:hypothetical protein